MSSKSLQEIVDNINRQQRKRHPILRTHTPKTTMTPFGEVRSELLTLNHVRPLRKGEVLAQWIRDKKTGKKEVFVWLGVVEMSAYSPITLKYTIYYRPFVSQSEKVKEREEQIWQKQMY